LIEPIEPGRRQRRRVLTDKQVANLPKKRKRYIISDPEMRGHYIRIPPEGPNVFVCEARDPYRKQIWVTIGSADKLGIEQARGEAREIIARIKKGLPPREPPPVKPDTFEAVAQVWLKRHVLKKELRTTDQIERLLRRYVLPHWGDRPFNSIRRGDIAKLCDYLEDNHGSRQSDIVLSILRGISFWYAGRNDDYVPPFIRGMRRHKVGARSRVLDDDEIRRIWKAAEAEQGSFGSLVKLLLLTAQRRAVVAGMKWDDIDADGTWTIRLESSREKGNIERVRLPAMALAIIRKQPRLARNEHILPSPNSAASMGGFSRAKRRLDARSGVSGWTLHDLRRTARSLMSRANVDRDHAERVLGHAIRGVEGVYDHFGYEPQKSAALAKLASLIGEIIGGEPRAPKTKGARRCLIRKRIRLERESSFLVG
jgi:integrase